RRLDDVLHVRSDVHRAGLWDCDPDARSDPDGRDSHADLQGDRRVCALLMLTSKGIAGVPRASLVVIAATLAQFHIPEAGLLLLLGVDHFLDMGRSATNVIGNSVATAGGAKWERELTP